ncbi:MAG TPA: DUF2062 domain-containing protein [Desulfonatronum sp.]|nr:DUF2062 domain-containing protein [Desulfonatronum sp.]
MNRKPRLWWENLLRGIRYAYKKMLRLKSSPHDVALGLALGVFMGLLPIIPFQSVTVLVLALALRCSKLAALLGTLISNPLNIPFLYFVMHRLGRFLLPELRSRYNPEHLTIGDLLHTGWHLFGTMLLGGVVIAIPSATATYFLARYLTRLHHARRARKMACSPYKKICPDELPAARPKSSDS